MQSLNLDLSSRAILTKTKLIPDPTNPAATIPQSFICDLNGNAITPPNPGLPIFRDLFSGKTFVRVAERIPSGAASADVAEAARINALNPVHFASPDGSVNGFFIVAPDFNSREPKAPAPPVPAQPLPAAQAPLNV
jgi:hypothetical protein